MQKCSTITNENINKIYKITYNIQYIHQSYYSIFFTKVFHTVCLTVAVD